MKNKQIRTIPLKRKLDRVTDYKKRFGLLKSGKLRLVVRRTNKNIIAQLVKYEPKGDKTVTLANSKDLEKFGWTKARANIPAAYLTGLVLAKKAGKDTEAILDMGLQKPTHGSRIYACLKGCVDGGLNIAHDPVIFPSDERISGTHNGLQKEFEETKKKILNK